MILNLISAGIGALVTFVLFALNIIRIPGRK